MLPKFYNSFWKEGTKRAPNLSKQETALKNIIYNGRILR